MSKYETGTRESAEKSMANAEKAYETVIHFLSDPKHATHLTHETIQECTEELERLDRLIHAQGNRDAQDHEQANR
jgi:hypothetical protein